MNVLECGLGQDGGLGAAGCLKHRLRQRSCDREALDGERARVLPVLATVPDPRARRRVRHRPAAILGLAVCAVLAGTWSFTVIAEWAADADQATPISDWPAMIRPDATPSGCSTGEHTATNRGRRARSKDGTPSHPPRAITTQAGPQFATGRPAGATSGGHTQRPRNPAAGASPR